MTLRAEISPEELSALKDELERLRTQVKQEGEARRTREVRLEEIEKENTQLRSLEVDGKLTLLDSNKVIRPHPYFRLFATANTVGLGDTTGLYHGTQQINQGQMDRWSIISTLNYLPHQD